MKTVLISGGTGGIGSETAAAFARAGYRVAILYHRNAEAAKGLAEKLSGFSLSTYACDVGNCEAVQTLARTVNRELGCPDVLVNCAGIARQGLFQELSEAELKEIFDVNFFGACYLTQAFLPGMISRQSGVILNVSSMWGITGASCEVAYSASKAALIGLTKSLAKEVGPSNIRVNAVAPGVIMTDMMKGYSEADLNRLREETPLCRLGRPEDVSSLLVYLASDGASFITGQVVSTDGGMVI